MDNYHKKLDKLQRDIDWIIQYLLKQNEPVQPPSYNPNVTSCSKCGMTFSGITHYWCPQKDCPIQTKVTL